MNVPLLNCLLDIKNNFETFLNTDYQVSNQTKFLYVNITHPELNHLYQEIITDFNNQNYLEMQNKLIKFNNLVIKLNIRIEVATTLYIVNNLIKSLNEEFNKKLTYYEETNIYDDSCKKFLLLGLKQQIINIKFIINYIDKLIYHNLSLANSLFDYLTNNYNLNNYETEITYLKNKLNEKNLYDNLPEENQIYYDLCIEKGRTAYEQNDLETAMYYYEAGKYVTNHPIFNYYIGKMYFKNKDYELAHQYFLSYEKDGGEKELKALLYIWAHLNSTKNTKKIIKLDEKAKQLISFYDNLKSWNLIDYKQYLRKTKRDNDFDIVKYKVSPKIFMTPSDFQESKLELSTFYNCSFKEKLIIIKNLYSTGHQNIADNLLKELQNNYPKSYFQKQISNIQKNKTLYLNKNK